MNQVIKFRAWDKTRDKMSAPFTFNDCIDCGIGEGVRVYKDFYLGWCELMQFTGLTDKNGKEIYEGDIVKTIWGGNKKITGKVIWGEGFVGWGIESSDFEYRISATAQAERKVIGNIFENPELLKTE